jgi:hypothetical protein
VLSATLAGVVTRRVDKLRAAVDPEMGFHAEIPLVAFLGLMHLGANGNIYAAFASFCDLNADLSRGWLLGWQAGSLTPLPANHLDNQLATSTNNYSLSSIWMSGYGVAADSSNNCISPPAILTIPLHYTTQPITCPRACQAVAGT